MGFSGGGGGVSQLQAAAINIAPNATCETQVSLMRLAEATGQSVATFNNTDNSWGDIFSDADGAAGTIDTGNTNGTFANLKYSTPVINECPSNILHNPSSFTDTSKFYDEDLNTPAYLSNSPYDCYLGKTFSERTIYFVFVKSMISFGSGASGSITLESYNGVSWDNEGYLSVNGSLKETAIILNKSCQGIRVHFHNSNPLGTNCTSRLYEMKYGSNFSDGIVQTNSHNLPSISQNPNFFMVYCNQFLNGSGNIKADVSFDDGVTWTEDCEINQIYAIMGNITNILKLKLKLNAGDSDSYAATDDFIVLWI